VFVRGQPDPHPDVTELVHDLELLGSNDTLLHGSWARLEDRARIVAHARARLKRGRGGNAK
jgi:hypothetical protein